MICVRFIASNYNATHISKPRNTIFTSIIGIEYFV